MFGLLLPLSMSAATAAEDDVMKELIPTGKLRAGIAYAPAKTPVFVTKDASGEVEGVGLDLARALARSLGVEVELYVAATTGELTDASTAGRIDIGFTPVDEERRQRVDFSPPYFIIESTYLVTAASGITTPEEVDRPEVTVAGIAGSTTIRAAGRTLKHAKIVPLKSVADAMAMMQAGTAQALALSRDAMPALQKTLAGLARSRRRLPSDGGRDVGAEKQACGARLCDALHREGQGRRHRPPCLRRRRLAGSRGRAAGE